MKKTMRQFFALLSRKSKSITEPIAPKDDPATIQDGSENGLRRQLVLLAMRDLLRRHGIPLDWMDCQMMMVSSRTRGSGMYVRIVVQHWDERLMNYANALQKELIADLQQSEPQAAHWLHGVSWQLEVDDSCPYTTLPARGFWLEPKAEATPTPIAATVGIATTTAASLAIPIPALQQSPPDPQAGSRAEPVNAAELERLFAIRDQELSERADHGVAAGYEKTQPAGL